MLFCKLKKRGKSRDKVISILRNVSFLMGQPKKKNVSFLVGQMTFLHFGLKLLLLWLNYYLTDAFLITRKYLSIKEIDESP